MCLVVNKSKNYGKHNSSPCEVICGQYYSLIILPITYTVMLIYD